MKKVRFCQKCGFVWADENDSCPQCSSVHDGN